MDWFERRLLRAQRHDARVWKREVAHVEHKPRKRVRWYEWVYQTADGQEFRCFRAMQPPEPVIHIADLSALAKVAN